MHRGFWWERQQERDHHWEDQYVGGRVMLEWIVEGSVGVVWTGKIILKVEVSGGLLRML
jgi:hypothetical protein